MANRYRDTTEALSTRWITLGQACKLLGVNESTLRRWADAKHVRSFRTPGGHRRFSEEDLRRMTEDRGGSGEEPYSSLGQLALTRIRRRLQRGRGHVPWYSGISEQDRERLRSLGRRLLALVSDYKTKGTRRSQLIDEAREIGHEYGRELVRERLSIRDALEAFTFFRRELDESAVEQVQKDDSLDEAVEMWELLTNLADQVLLAIAETYEEAETPAVSG